MTDADSIAKSETNAPWKSRPVLWGVRDGIRHVVLYAVILGSEVVQTIACGGVTSHWGIEITAYHSAKRRRWRICRKCLDALQRAGISDQIGGVSRVSH